jgi:hypothetical protein
VGKIKQKTTATNMYILYAQPTNEYMIKVREFCMANNLHFSTLVKRLIKYAVENNLLEKIAKEVKNES